MPGRDGTGPYGEGPLTGRGLGPCGCGLRRGAGFRRGFGRGLGLRAVPVARDENEREFLEEEKELLKQDLAEVEKRLKEIKS